MIVKYKQIEFIIKGKIVLLVKDCTLPEAIQAGKDFKPIDNFGLTISCYYY